MGWYTNYTMIFKLCNKVDIDKILRDVNNCEKFLPAGKYEYMRDDYPSLGISLEAKESIDLVSFIEKYSKCKIDSLMCHSFIFDGIGLLKSNIKLKENVLTFEICVKRGHCCNINFYIPIYLFYVGEKNVISVTYNVVPEEEMPCETCMKNRKKPILLQKTVDEKPLPTWYIS